MPKTERETAGGRQQGKIRSVKILRFVEIQIVVRCVCRQIISKRAKDKDH